VQETFEVEDNQEHQKVCSVSTSLWGNYQPGLATRQVTRPEEHYAAPLMKVVSDELKTQRSSKYRGVGKFQEGRIGRVCWEERVASQSFPRLPQMTRAQSGDMGPLCKLMYYALHNVLDRCPLNPNGRKQRSVTEESEFKKHGMIKRVFHHISRFSYTADQWCQPRAVLEAVQAEFDHLEGMYGKTFAIFGFNFF
jgi:hypothetical protein